jgi:hypothetical protein
MEHPRVTTLDEDRPISAHEAEIVTWMLLHVSVGGSLAGLVETVKQLRVVGRCSCGCPSVEFVVRGQTLPFQPIADATAQNAFGAEIGVSLWARSDAITGLEFYEMAVPVNSLPLARTLKTW